MRLPATTLDALRDALPRLFGADAAVYLYGSRTLDYRERAALVVTLEDALHLPVDLLVEDALDEDQTIYHIARLSGVRLQ